MSAQFVRWNTSVLSLGLSLALGACGGPNTTPLAPAVPSDGPCVAFTASTPPGSAIINGTACDEATSSVVLLSIRLADGASVVRCSGTVIGGLAVLTAAHCVSGHPAAVSVLRGRAPEIPAQSFTVHPEYRSAPFALDVAVVRTAEPIGRRPVPLLTSRAGRVGERGVLAGWGADQNGSSSVLRAGMASVDFVADTYLTTRVTESSAGVCGGDSGGPLLLSSGSTEWALAGVTSAWTFNPGTDAPLCQHGVAVYTSVRTDSVASFIRGLVPDAIVR